MRLQVLSEPIQKRICTEIVSRFVLNEGCPVRSSVVSFDHIHNQPLLMAKQDPRSVPEKGPVTLADVQSNLAAYFQYTDQVTRKNISDDLERECKTLHGSMTSIKALIEARPKPTTRAERKKIRLEGERLEELLDVVNELVVSIIKYEKNLSKLGKLVAPHIKSSSAVPPPASAAPTPTPMPFQFAQPTSLDKEITAAALLKMMADLDKKHPAAVPDDKDEPLEDANIFSTSDDQVAMALQVSLQEKLRLVKQGVPIESLAGFESLRQAQDLSKKSGQSFMSSLADVDKGSGGK